MIERDEYEDPYAEKYGPYRFRCDYCGRILRAEGVKPFSCTACGHGRMRLEKPTAYCCECDFPIYANVDSSRDVVCWLCTHKLSVHKHSSIAE